MIQNLATTSLPNLHKEIEKKTVGAAVFQLGYPQLFPLVSLPGPDCPFLGAADPYDISERLFFQQIRKDLNAALALAAAQSGIQYVPVDFAGHEACSLSGEDWINGFRLFSDGSFNVVESFHPNASGQRQYANVLNRYITDKIANKAPTLPNGLPKNPTPIPPAVAPQLRAAQAVAPPSFGDLHVRSVSPGCPHDQAYGAGQLVEVTGGGFGPSEIVTVLFIADQGAMQETLGTTTADETGAIDASVMIPAGAPTSGYAPTAGTCC
jgi:hypothetical protein